MTHKKSAERSKVSSRSFATTTFHWALTVGRCFPPVSSMCCPVARANSVPPVAFSSDFSIWCDDTCHNLPALFLLRLSHVRESWLPTRTEPPRTKSCLQCKSKSTSSFGHDFFTSDCKRVQPTDAHQQCRAATGGLAREAPQAGLPSPHT